MITLRTLNRMGKRQRRPVRFEKLENTKIPMWVLIFTRDNNNMPYCYFTSLDKAWEFLRDVQLGRTDIQFGLTR